MLKHLKRKTQAQRKDNKISLILTSSLLLTVVGLFFIFEASSVTAFRNLGDSFFFLRLQLIWFMVGIGSLIFFSFFDYKKLYYLSVPILTLSLILLFAVLIPGIGTSVLGARRWINLGFVTIQPSELAKFGVILYLASWFSHKERHRFVPFVLLLGIIIGLVMAQPDMGTAVIIFGLFLVIYFLSEQEILYLFLLIPSALFSFIVLVRISPYRLKRLTAFLNPEHDPQGVGYHINQILISLSSGGIFGRGFSESRQKYQFLPEAHTDSIFAIIGEELGFVGGAVLFFLYFLLFGRLLAGAFFAVFALQVIINIGGMVSLIPLTGVPLPFVSYGGSSLVVFLTMIGILINIRSQS